MIKVKNVTYQDFTKLDAYEKPDIGFYYWQNWGKFDFEFENGYKTSIKLSDVAGGCGPVSLYNYGDIEDFIYIKAMIKHIINLMVNGISPCTSKANFLTITHGGIEFEAAGKRFRKMLKSLGFKEHVSLHIRHGVDESDYFQSFFVLDLSPYYTKEEDWSDFEVKEYKERLKKFKKLS